MSRSIVQFNLRPGVGGVPPIVSVPRNSAGSEWFTVTDASDDDGPKIHVEEGRIDCPKMDGYNSFEPSITAFLRQITVAGGEFPVTDGDKVWCKITADAGSRSGDYLGQDSPKNLVKVTVKPREKVWYATAGQIIVQPDDPTESHTQGWVLLAEISVTEGVVSIKPRHTGSISAPPVSLGYALDPLVEIKSATYTVCVSGSPVSVVFLSTTA